MGTVEGDSAAHGVDPQRVMRGALHRREERRVIGDDERGARGDGLRRDVGRVIDRDEHLADIREGVADEEPDVVPALRVTERRQLVERGDDLRELHGSRFIA